MKLEKSVYDLVVATVADYDRMARRIAEGGLPPDQVAAFVRKISAVDHALSVVCEREREEVKRALQRDIAERRGYERSVSRDLFGSKKAFDRRKAQAIYLIARMTDLI